MSDKATGGPVDPSRAYWIGEHDLTSCFVPDSFRPIDLSDATVTLDNTEATLEKLRGLKDSTFTFSGTFDSTTTDMDLWLRNTPPVAVSIQIPASRWQALKARLKRIPGLGWLPVRYAWDRQIIGRIEPWPDGGGYTINAQPEEPAP